MLLSFFLAVVTLVAGLFLLLFGFLGPGIFTAHGLLAAGLGVASLFAAYTLLAASL